jgi:Peptidase family S51
VGELLLLSNSTAPGMRFLEHASQAVRAVLGGARTVLFVPFAGGDPDAYASLVRAALARMDTRVTSLHEASDVPVLGLREGAWLRVSGRRAVLSGNSTGRLFRRHAEPADVPIGTDLSNLLDTRPRFDVGPGG